GGQTLSWGRSAGGECASGIAGRRAALGAGKGRARGPRHFDEKTGVTTPGRSKEYASDYRYVPEPDLPPIEPDTAWIEQIRASLPELPAARRHRFAHTYGVKPELAKVLAASKDWSDFFEETVGLGAAPVAVANWMIQDLAALANAA